MRRIPVVLNAPMQMKGHSNQNFSYYSAIVCRFQCVNCVPLRVRVVLMWLAMDLKFPTNLNTFFKTGVPELESGP